MRHAARFLTGVVSLVVLTAVFAATPPKRDDPGSGPVGPVNDNTIVSTPSLWFVELSSPPLAELTPPSDYTTTKATLDGEHQAFKVNAAQAGLKYKERYSYENLWNGVSIEIDPRDVLKLARVPGVSAFYPVQTVEAPERGVPVAPGDYTTELYTAITMTGADVAHANGWTGTGIKVAIIDTGIDYNHPDLGGCFGAGCRVTGGFDFVGDSYTGGTDNIHPDPDPMDCAGHGTHVAGIVGANGGVVGVAPDVTFRAYRVFGCSGSTTDDVILTAMEQVLADGNDVLNMSLGAAFTWPQSPTARGADNLVNHGVTVVCSIGNSGANGLYSTGAPGVGLKSIGSASVDNLKAHLPAIQTGAGSLVGYAAMDGAPPAPTTGTFDVVNFGRGCNGDPMPAGTTGKIALITRGTCSFREKSLNARAAGAASVVIMNNATGIFFGTVAAAGLPNLTIPVVGISREDGLLIQSQMATTLTWTALLTDTIVPTGGLISTFSSLGASPDLALKPDIAAPGGLIFSTLPLAQGGYGVLSGTSMASPHVAGAAALLLQAKPNTPSQVVRDVLQNSASPRLFFGNPGLGLLESTHREGAGMVNIDAAIRSTTKVTPGKLSLGETEGLQVTRTLTIENKGGADEVYDLSHTPAVATGANTFTPSFSTAAASVAFSANPVAVPAGGTATVDITFTQPASLANKGMFDGFIGLTPEDGSPALHVPYMGFKGDYQSIVVLNAGASSFGNPILRQAASFGPSGPATITKDTPAFILYHLDHQSRRFRLEAFEYPSGRAVGRLFDSQYNPRNATAGEFSILTWDGASPDGGFVANGTYTLRLTVQKALGDTSNPAHTETWISPVITVDRTGGGEPLP